MANYYVSSVAYAAVAQWAATTVYTLGQYRRQLAAQTQGNERVFKCTTAGISGSSEPTWSRNNNATTTDGTVTWTQVSGQETNQSAGSWTAPAASIQIVKNLFTLANTDFVFVSSDHDYEYTSNPSLVCSGQCVSVSRVGVSLPPTATDYSAGAKEATTGNVSFSVSSTAYCKGITFRCGSGPSASGLTLNINSSGNGTYSVWEDCTFDLQSTNSASLVTLSSGHTFAGGIKLIRPTFNFASTNNRISLTGNDSVEIVKPSFTGSTPAALFGTTSAGNQTLVMRQADLSGLAALRGSAVVNFLDSDFWDCKFAAGMPEFLAVATNGVGHHRYYNCDDGNRTYKYAEQNYHGFMQTNDVVGRVGGASDGVSLYSLMMHSHGNAAQNGDPHYFQPLYSVYMSQYLTSLSAVSATVEFCSTFALDTSTAWLDIESLDDSGSTLGSGHSTRPATILTVGSALTTTTSDWTGGSVSARTNSHAYSLGDAIKLSSNSGRLFICMTAGTSASSEPGGFASAVDGGSVTDGTAVFKAVLRYKISVSFTPGRNGDCRGRLAIATSVDNSSKDYVFLDPLMKVV